MIMLRCLGRYLLIIMCLSVTEVVRSMKDERDVLCLERFIFSLLMDFASYLASLFIIL